MVAIVTKTEMLILDTLWKSETSLCAADIIERNPGIKEITIRTALKNMLKKELISVDGMVQRTKNFARTFRANVTSEEILYNSVKKTTNLSPFKFACALLKEDNFSDTELNTLKKIIDERVQNK